MSGLLEGVVAQEHDADEHESVVEHGRAQPHQDRDRESRRTILAAERDHERESREHE